MAEINYDVEITSRYEYLAELSNSVCSSQRAKHKNWHAEYVDLKICCDKGLVDEQHEVLPVELYTEVAGKIIDLFQSRDKHVPLPVEVLASSKLVAAMKPDYDSEDSRFSAFIAAIHEYIPWEKTDVNGTGFYDLRRNNGSDGFMTCPVANVEAMALISLVEAKWEVGSSGDPTVQGNLDYSKLCGKMYEVGIPGTLPCLLVTISGTIMTVQLAVIGKYVTICSLCDGFQFQGREKVIAGAQLLWAINESHLLLQNYYITLPAVLPPASLPFLHRFEISGEVVNIKYTRRIKSGTNSFVFEVEVVDEESHWFSFSFIVKFSRQYSAEAHQLLSEDSRSYRLAPTLHSLKELAGGWKALFIEKIDGCLTFHQARTLPQQDRRAIIENVSQSLKKLHSHGLVHGDLRFPNVLIVTRPTRAYLIDFDWCGVEGEATYPHDINLGELHWVDVEDLPMITKKHDLAALLNFSKRIRAPLE